MIFSDQPGLTDNRMKSAVIFSGMPGSGKSTFYRKYFVDRYVHINLDTLHTRRKEELLLNQCIQKSAPFVVDNTNPTAEDRLRYIMPAKLAGYKVTGYYFKASISDCITRNALREGKARVPVKAIKAISSKRKLPATEEGFDNLYAVSIDNGEFVIKKWGSNAAALFTHHKIPQP